MFVFLVWMIIFLLWNNLSIGCEYVLLLLLNKKADWPMARQNKARWESQTKNTEGKKGRVKETPAAAEQLGHVEKEVTDPELYGTMQCNRNGLISM